MSLQPFALSGSATRASSIPPASQQHSVASVCLRIAIQPPASTAAPVVGTGSGCSPAVSSLCTRVQFHAVAECSMPARLSHTAGPLADRLPPTAWGSSERRAVTPFAGATPNDRRQSGSVPSQRPSCGGRAAKVLAPLVCFAVDTGHPTGKPLCTRPPPCPDAQRGSRSLRWPPRSGVMVACTAPPDGRPCWFNPHLIPSADDTGGWVPRGTPTPALANLPVSHVDRRQPHRPRHPLFF